MVRAAGSPRTGARSGVRVRPAHHRRRRARGRRDRAGRRRRGMAHERRTRGWRRPTDPPRGGLRARRVRGRRAGRGPRRRSTCSPTGKAGGRCSRSTARSTSPRSTRSRAVTSSRRSQRRSRRRTCSRQLPLSPSLPEDSLQASGISLARASGPLGMRSAGSARLHRVLGRGKVRLPGGEATVAQGRPDHRVLRGA